MRVNMCGRIHFIARNFRSIYIKVPKQELNLTAGEFNSGTTIGRLNAVFYTQSI